MRHLRLLAKPLREGINLANVIRLGDSLSLTGFQGVLQIVEPSKMSIEIVGIAPEIEAVIEVIDITVIEAVTGSKRRSCDAGESDCNNDDRGVLHNAAMQDPPPVVRDQQRGAFGTPGQQRHKCRRQGYGK